MASTRPPRRRPPRRGTHRFSTLVGDRFPDKREGTPVRDRTSSWIPLGLVASLLVVLLWAINTTG